MSAYCVSRGGGIPEIIFFLFFSSRPFSVQITYRFRFNVLWLFLPAKHTRAATRRCHERWTVWYVDEHTRDIRKSALDERNLANTLTTKSSGHEMAETAEQPQDTCVSRAKRELNNIAWSRRSENAFSSRVRNFLSLSQECRRRRRLESTVQH